MKTAIMTDTNSGLSVTEGKELGIYVVPMPVLIEDQCYLEGLTITSEELYAAMEADKKVTTSQPSPGDLLDAWEDILQEGYDEIIYIPMTSSLSGSCQNAAFLAEEFEGKVVVADNHRISVTLKEAAFQAKRMADRGISAAAIREYLEETAYDASIYLTVDNLKYLQKSGRLSASESMLGTILNIKPLLTFQGDKIEAIGKVRGMKACEKKMISALQADIENRFSQVPEGKLQVAVAGTLRRKEDIDHWIGLMEQAFPNQKVYYDLLPCSIATHTGPDAVGIGVYINAE